MQEQEKCIVIPRDRLSEAALQGLVEEFILREGTDYGSQEVSFPKKKEQVFRQLDRGDAVIVYSTMTENTTIMTRSDFARLGLQ